MATMLKIDDILIPRKNEYVRGGIKRDNLVRLATALVGKGWPFDPVTVRKLNPPVERGKRTYRYAMIDGVHRHTLATATLNPKIAEKLNKLLRAKGQDTLPKGASFAEIPARVEEMNETEGEVEQLRTNLAHGLLVDRGHRDQWVRYLVKTRKLEVPKLAKLLAMTERSVYRMVKGTQVKAGPRKKMVRKPKSESQGSDNGKVVAWTPAAWVRSFEALARETARNASALETYSQTTPERAWIANAVAAMTESRK